MTTESLTLSARDPRLIVEIRSRLEALRDTYVARAYGATMGGKTTAGKTVLAIEAMEKAIELHCRVIGNASVRWTTCATCHTSSACFTLRHIAAGVGIRVV